jgi:hypothetical protein
MHTPPFACIGQFLIDVFAFQQQKAPITGRVCIVRWSRFLGAERQKGPGIFEKITHRSKGPRGDNIGGKGPDLLNSLIMNSDLALGFPRHLTQKNRLSLVRLYKVYVSGAKDS